MERTAKVSFDFIIFSPPDKGLFGDNVIAEMTEHSSVFSTPDIPISELSDANNTLKTKTQQALSGDTVKIEERNAAEKVWDTKFRKEGEYVQRIASGDKLIIAQSGYHSTQTEVHPVQQPAQAQLDAWGNKGIGSGIHAEIKPLADVRGIIFLLANQPINGVASINGDVIKVKATSIAEIELQAILGTKRKVEFDDLITGHSYFITAFGFNATGVGELANVREVTAP